MAQYNKSVPKSPNCDQTLEAVLDSVIFYTEGGDKLVGHQILPDKIMLTFDDGGD